MDPLEAHVTCMQMYVFVQAESNTCANKEHKERKESKDSKESKDHRDCKDRKNPLDSAKTANTAKTSEPQEASRTQGRQRRQRHRGPLLGLPRERFPLRNSRHFALSSRYIARRV